MGSVQAFKENCVTMSIEGDAPQFRKGAVIRMEDQVKRIQEDLGFSGKDADGMFGKKSSAALFDKYGDVNDPKIREQLPDTIRQSVEALRDKVGPGIFTQHPPRVQIASCLPTDNTGEVDVRKSVLDDLLAQAKNKDAAPKIQLDTSLPTGSIGQSSPAEQHGASGKTHRLRGDDDVVQKGRLESTLGLTNTYNSKAPATTPAEPAEEFNVMTPMGDFTGFTAPANRM